MFWPNAFFKKDPRCSLFPTSVLTAHIKEKRPLGIVTSLRLLHGRAQSSLASSLLSNWLQRECFVIKHHWRLSHTSLGIHVGWTFLCGRTFIFFWNWTKIRKTSRGCDMPSLWRASEWSGRTHPHSRCGEDKWHQVGNGTERAQTAGIRFKCDATPDHHHQVTPQPSGHGWGWPVRHLLG